MKDWIIDSKMAGIKTFDDYYKQQFNHVSLS